MERLTGPKWSNRHYHIYANVYPKRKDMEPAFQKIVDRLGRYEDTGLEPEEIPHWISVSVPPKAEGWYLVAVKCDTEYHVEQDFYATDIAKEHGHEPGFCKARHFHITHWMPLPAAPKEEK